MINNSISCFLIFAFAFAFVGCREENVLPKPRAMLRLEFSKTSMSEVETDNFKFEYNTRAKFKVKNSSSLVLEYPEMKGAIFINYRKVDKNISSLIADAQKLSFEHAAKADGIRPRIFENEENQVYGTFYEVSGDAASQAQFFVTDSVNHFVTGSLYFAAKPNYDSIYPAASYLQKDMGRIMETLRWK